MFTLSIKTENAAFHDADINQGDARIAEIARILHTLADNLNGTSVNLGTIKDSNGNTVGDWSLVE